MNPRRSAIIIGALVIAGLLVVYWFRDVPEAGRTESRGSASDAAAKPDTLSVKRDAQGRILPVGPTASVERKEPDSSEAKSILAAYLAPISFFGKVVDEHGAPVGDARVELITADRPLANGATYERFSDGAGRFQVVGAHGASVAVWVSKRGYYSTSASKGRFVYGGVRGGGEPKNPTPSDPAIFVLRKMGETEPLIVVDRDVVIPKDGRPVEISLRTGRAVPTGQGDIVVECWINNEGIDPNQNERFDWRMRLTIPNGGLIERDGEFAFVAPEAGYRPSEEVNMPKNAEMWRSTIQREYFVKTRSGSFARINVRMTAGGGHFVTVRAHLNPTPGSRNLEFDSAKAIAASP